MKKELSQSESRANPLMTSFATTLIGKVLLHVIVPPEKVCGQEKGASKQAGSHLVCAKVTAAMVFVGGTIARKLQ